MFITESGVYTAPEKVRNSNLAVVKIFDVGSFVVGMTIRVPRMPGLGEGLIGDQFDLGPGGKGTNQAIAVQIYDRVGYE